ncbi:MAG TPA: SUMF1/EgtB/PvdO family nonheme iron enzyme [Planctomycetota bacterium]|nr:SUMF1/EgtB/PvdO family nonheme iron enzyme [Planctomycetota bacterium]
MRTQVGSRQSAVGSVVALAIAAALASCERAEAPSAAKPQVITTQSGIEMVALPAGWLDMGSRAGDPDEQPVHRVWLDAFVMDRTEVTQGEYKRLVLADPSHFKGDRLPVEMINWGDAALYCNARSKAEGFAPCYDPETARCDSAADGYRLPTEAEWEYACRAGTTTVYPFGSDPRLLADHASFAANSGKRTHPVGEKAPNPWGLHDMLGNVAEWCNDVYEPTYYAASPQRNPAGPAEGKLHVLRGGAWNSSPDACRPAYRVGQAPGMQDACFSDDAIGFRCVRRPKAGPGTVALSRERATIARGTFGPTGASHPPVIPSLSRNLSGELTIAVELRPLAGGCRSERFFDKLRMTRESGAQGPEGAKGPRTPPTGFLYGDIYLQHKTGPGHPDRPERLTAMVERLKEKGLLEQLVPIQPAPAAIEWITTVHSEQYVERLKKGCEEGVPFMDTRDSPVCKETFEVARNAVGGVLAAADAVMAGRVRNAFCAIRPPGHHALKDQAMGFCYFNNVAITARYLQKKHKLAKVLIVDWDVHHGNGTQAAFDDDPTVFYFSVHLHPFYPRTGLATDRGTGKAVGTKLNVPLPAGSGDAEYKKAFEEQLRPAALAFKPDFVLISCGFDAHADDLLGRMKVTTPCYAELTRIVKGIAEKCCGGRLISVFEGGYNLDNLASAAEAHVRALME